VARSVSAVLIDSTQFVPRNQERDIRIDAYRHGCDAVDSSDIAGTVYEI
jgi:hypothetical protein